MKILHCNTYDSGGGAAIAAKRIHAGLLAEGVDSRLGVLRRTSEVCGVFALSGRWRRALQPLAIYAEHLPLRVCERDSHAFLFSLGMLPLPTHWRINAAADSADIIHAHWIADSFIPVGALGRIIKPLVWTVHDTWTFTAGCHILQGCTQYEQDCGDCPQVPPRARWLVRRAFVARQKAYARCRPYIVSPSQALLQNVGQSALLANAPRRCIPNGIDTSLFFPLEKTNSRHILGVPQGEKIIAFGAMDAFSDLNKGFDLLTQALEILLRFYAQPVRLLVFGGSLAQQEQHGFPITCLGRLHDDISLRLAYSAADVFVCPSREENLPNTVMESLACGTPVAAFSVGGIPDMVEHGVNGCLATPHDPLELARGIAHILEDDERRTRMGQAARKVVEERYAAPVIARQYMNLYEEILSQTPRTAS